MHIRYVQNDLDYLCIASGGSDRAVRLWDLHCPFKSGASDNTIALWDITSGMQLQILDGHVGPVTQIAFYESFDVLVILCSAGLVAVVLVTVEAVVELNS